jgi:hypothetical protein
VLFQAAAAEKAAGGSEESTVHTSLVGAASSYAPLHLQQPIATGGVTKIHVKYQSVI